MFRDATSFNGNISNWEVSNVWNMQNIFYNGANCCYILFLKRCPMENDRTVRWRFSLRTLMIGVLFSSVLAYCGRFGTHLVLFLFAVTFVVTCMVLSLRRRQTGHRVGTGMVVLLLASWCLFYVASLGPAAMLFDGPGIAGEICEFIYAPLIFADQLLPSRPFDRYADRWQRMLEKNSRTTARL